MSVQLCTVKKQKGKPVIQYTKLSNSIPKISRYMDCNRQTETDVEGHAFAL